MNTVKFITLGCKVNQYDTQSIRERFISAGFKEIDNGCKAGTYVINTCTVTSIADRKSRYFIHYAHRQNPKARIIVTGCYAELDSDKIAKIPGVTDIIKNQDKDKIVELLNGPNALNEINEPHGTGIADFKSHTRAFLKIQDGCNNFCAYCKVPLVRGNSRSRPLNDIIKEAERLVKNNFKEIVLCGICLGSYGKDTNSHESKAEFSRIIDVNNSYRFVPERSFQKSLDLVDVIEALERITGLLRIRLSSIEAGDVSERLIEKIAQSKKLCRHLHIPIQSGDDEILGRMNRSYKSSDYLNLIKRIKRYIPEVAITTDVMVGFPGENEENFQNTVKLIKEIQPLRTHIFPYSRREGTLAAKKFKEKSDYKAIKERINYLKKITQDCSLTFRKQFLNQNMDMLIEKRVQEDKSRTCTQVQDKGYWQGYTDSYIKVKAEVNPGLNLKNKLVNVRLKNIDADFMWADLC